MKLSDMTDIPLREEIRRTLDCIDWTTLNVPRSAVEADARVAEQLAAGKPTDLVTYSVTVPGVPEPVEKTVRLISQRIRDEKTWEWKLHPRIKVEIINQ